MFQADTVEIVVLVENWIDMLLPPLKDPQSDHECVSRTGLIHHFDPKRIPPQAENGISFFVRATRGRSIYTVLFDVGLTGSVLVHNFRALDLDPLSVDYVLISHGHPDHYGGIFRFLEEVPRPIPVATHGDAFLPRYAIMGDGQTSTFYNAAFRAEDVEGAGGRLVLTREPVELGHGMLTTGEIPRTIAFEGPQSPPVRGAPGLYQVSRSGEFGLDEVLDEQALIIDVRDEGLVVMTGCAHAGVINTILRARAVVGDRPVSAVMGGFHLGFPTTPPENVEKTIDALREMDVRKIMPMHCSGLKCHIGCSTQLADRYIQPAVGTVLRFGG